MSQASQDPNRIEILIRDLVSTYVDKPESLKIGFQTSKDELSVYWMLKGDPDDEPKLVGKGGSHVDALKFLIEQMGKVKGRTYTFRLITERAPRGPVPVEYRDAVEFNPKPTRKLIERLLFDLGIGPHDATVRVHAGNGPRQSLRFFFEVVADARAYEALSVPPEDDLDRQTIVVAIGTLLRASAKCIGVRFDLTALPPAVLDK